MTSNIKTKIMKNTEKDISRIMKHNNALEKIPFVINKNDSEGYIYCIKNKLFEGYSEPIYKVSGTININKMLISHNTCYLENTILVRKLKVPRKLFYEYMMILRLYKYRINNNKCFYINLNKINKAFDEMENMLNTKNEDEIHSFYLNYFESFNQDIYCNQNLKINKIANYIPEIKLNKKKTLKINLNDDNCGYIYWIEHPYIKTYFNNKIQILIPSSSNDVPWIKSNFLEDITVVKIVKLNFFGIGKNMFYELTYLNNIKSCFYQFSKEDVIKIFNLIDKYFNTYNNKFELNFAFGQRVL